MDRSALHRFVCLFAGTTIGLWSLLVAPVPSTDARLKDRIVAIVNTDLVMESDVASEIAPELDRLARTTQGDELDRQRQRAHHVGVTRLIERRLQLQAAKSKGVEVTDDDVNRTLEEMKRHGEKVDPADPKARQSIKEQLLLMRVVEREVRGGITISDAEMRRYFKEHESRFALPEEYTLSQILIQPRPTDTPEDVRVRTARVIDGLKSGETFEELALRYSDGVNTARGGRLGLVRQGELHAPIEQALASLQPGQTTGAIESPEGIHIIRIDDRRPRQFRPFEEVRAEIQSLVFAQKSEDFFQTWLAELKDKAYIEVKF
ncbi:MAG: peptidyl-prolyl cis-trans isomerase [Nitrospiraceae bacterium]